ncbi:Methionyl-tRNA formyltransferase [Acholeplasma oculi]|uniref:Methionyl-tRNA formyltransferase n=1 Tax=Acholeplasma oculi TaxID=35623 RepID=A0A061AHY9_9MOLU|nr:methionyl-tRNA formyltransferase [Acholeplasma oculi]CDR31186.1 Methionyl-tRNA formyltransferase [Acholeplasma oculi]SKC37801.1 methionyl-tRNA formyltransferase [Acholeplasma oculi]SUT91090.1 Methionyl-tRNA formyltransferase [Acholeplasma oculi]
MIVFMGTPEFSVPILKMLIEKKYDVSLVVTQPDSYVGRKKVLTESPVKKLAKSYGIEVFQPEKLKENYQYIIDKKPKLIITASYGQILPKALLDKVKAVNIHGSLLPSLRGGAPIQYALFNGLKETGITLMEMAFKMDSGDMIEHVKVTIEDQDNYLTLSQKLSIAGRDLLEKRMDDLLLGTYHKEKQDESLVTFAYTLKYSDESLDFNQNAIYNHNRVRGLSPDIGAHFEYKGTTIKVFQSLVSDIIDLSPGKILISQKRLFIGCNGQALEILELQQAGKKRMMVRDFLNGQTLFSQGENIYE